MQSLSLLVFVLLVFAVKDSYQLSSRVVEQRGLCNQTFASYHVERRTSIQTYVVNYYFGCGSWWNRRRCHGTRTGYRRINVYMSPAVYYTAVLTCCYGYNGEPPNCEGIKNEFYLSFFHHLSNSPSIVIMTSKHQTIFYSIRAPGLGYNISGHFTASNKAIIDLPKSLMTTSHEQHNKGVYIMTNGSRVTLLSGNGASDSYVAFPNARVCFQEYVYYGILFGFGHVLVVGTEDNTILKLTVEPQAVNITLHHNNTTLVSPGKQYSFIINRLQTVLIEMVKESKIVANKPISTFSGHKCGSVPTKSGVCGHIVEQIPPTTLWGKVYYTVPFSNRSEYTIKVLAACDNTNIDIYCDGIVTSYTIHEGMDVTKTLDQEQCVIYSNKKLLASLYSHSYWDTNDDQYKHNPMMTLVPSVDLYSNKISSSTISNSNPVRSDYTHYVNIIVLAEYYQPEMIHLITGGLSHSMDSQQWESIEANGTIEAYATTATISEGVVEIIHANTSALMTAIVYGFANSASYGHSGGSYNLEKFTDCRVCDDIQSNTSSPNITGLPEVKVIPTEQTVEITHSAKFSTVVIGVGVGNFVYQWRYNGINIIGETGDTLLLSEVLKRHKGRYDCIVTNEYGVYAISNKAKLNFRRNPPHATVQPNVAFASLAANFDFHCESNGAVSYKWERLNGRIPSGAIGKNSNALTIYNVQLEDADHYRCVATNKSGSGVSDYVELTINTYIPHLIEHPKNQTVDIYTSTNFECKAKLYGSTQINWKKEGSSRLPASATVATNISNDVITSILKIDEIISYYSGDYYCAATNEIGEANSSQAQLHVNIPCPEY
ncbi:uncharacterized protein [Dysidea avara]|uniref:uncharacterized protein isoform X2 n=1 Tax=Dysidea avara TaxID=196820 RepID=UPI00331EA203